MDANMCVKDKIRFAFLLWNYEWASVDHNCATYFTLQYQSPCALSTKDRNM